MMRRCLRTLSSSLISSSPYSSITIAHALSPVNVIISPLDKLDINDFRQRAFYPKRPLLITISTDLTVNTTMSSSIPATKKWFTVNSGGDQLWKCRYLLDNGYLGQFGHTFLPYELLSSPADVPTSDKPDSFLTPTVDNPTFRRFHAPLDLFLTTSQLSQPPQLY